VFVAVLCRYSPLDIVTPSTMAMIMLHTPPAMIVVCPARVYSGAGPPLPLPALDAAIDVHTGVSTATTASSP
jgi:hypothetical protein